MAVYATADLHGYPLAEFRKLLGSCGFSPRDDLYVLGDVIDRHGSGGIDLLRWMMCQSNVELIMGNHEAMMLRSTFAFREITEENLDALTADELDQLSLWLANGGEVTLKTMKALLRSDPELVQEILAYCEDAPLYACVEAGGREFVLVHAGLGGFSPDKDLSDYTPDELLWIRPELEDRYYDDRITVFGHTPTEYYGEEFRGRALRTPTWINIDTGAQGKALPMLLRLDDLQEFYP